MNRDHGFRRIVIIGSGDHDRAGKSVCIAGAKIFAGPLEARFPPKYLVDRRGQAARQAPRVAAFVSMLLTEDVVMRPYDFSPLFRSTVGFDRLFDMLDNGARPDWPPYNIERHGENQYRISMVRIPMHRGHLLRFDRGQATDLIAATIPI